MYIFRRPLAPTWKISGNCFYQRHSDQRWSPWGRPWPRGHILKSFALALVSKVKSLASRPQVLKNCPVFCSRTVLFFEWLKFWWKKPETSRKICEDLSYFPLSEIAWKNCLKTSFLCSFVFVFLRSPERFFWRPFFLENTSACVLGFGLEHSATRGSVLGRPAFDPGLEPCVLDSTSNSEFIKCNAPCPLLYFMSTISYFPIFLALLRLIHNSMFRIEPKLNKRFRLITKKVEF